MPAFSQSYTTRFVGTEDPISENGGWTNESADWTHIRKVNGIACGTQTGTNTGIYKYDDSYAHLSGFPPDQEAWGEVHIADAGASCIQELEILLRWSGSPHRTTGYECFAHCVNNAASYVQIVRWDGALGKFTYLADLRGTNYGLKNGDILKASIIGNRIRVSINGVEKAHAVDDSFKTGNPGIGEYFDCEGGKSHGANADFGFSSFTARAIGTNEQRNGVEFREKFIPSFAVKYGGPEGWPALEDAARFDLLVMGAGTARNSARGPNSGNTWQELKALNPRLVMLLYEIGPGEYNTAGWGRIGQGWDWIAAEHGVGAADRWTALGTKSGQYLQGQAYGNERLMVPGNPAWQQYWLDNLYSKYWSDPGKPTAIADGLFADNTSYTMPYVGGWHPEGRPETHDVPADYYSGTQYNAALYHGHMKSFFARAFPWLAARKVKLGLNFGDIARKPADWAELDQEPDAPFAAMEEGAFVHPWGGKGSFVFRPEEEWLRQIRVMRELKQVRVLMNVHGPVEGDAKGIDRMDGRDASGNRAWDVLWYAMMSFLQGINPERSNACLNFTVWSYLEFHWFKEFDPRFLDLGRARGESHRIDGRQGRVYAREFEAGWAVVNPTAQAALGIAVPEGQARIVDHDTLERPENRPLQREFDLPPHRGVVLLKAGRTIAGSSHL